MRQIIWGLLQPSYPKEQNRTEYEGIVLVLRTFTLEISWSKDIHC